MNSNTLSAQEAAEKLGISTSSFYDWLAQSNAGQFMLRGRSATIDYYQGGRKGQGRIRIKQTEVDRLMGLMRVAPQSPRSTRSPRQRPRLTHINSPLGRPEE